MRREPRPLRSPVFASRIRRTRRRGSRRPPPRLPTRLFTKPAHGRVSEPMAAHALADNLAVEHIERGEQSGRAVALIVMGHGAATAALHRQPPAGSGRALGFG